MRISAFLNALLYDAARVNDLISRFIYYNNGLVKTKKIFSDPPENQRE
jgi:hypothetical protein